MILKSHIILLFFSPFKYLPEIKSCLPKVIYSSKSHLLIMYCL